MLGWVSTWVMSACVVSFRPPESDEEGAAFTASVRDREHYGRVAQHSAQVSAAHPVQVWAEHGLYLRSHSAASCLFVQRMMQPQFKSTEGQAWLFGTTSKFQQCVSCFYSSLCFIQRKLKQHKRLKILCNQSVLHQQGEVYERVGHHHSAGSSSGKSAALRPGRRLPHREHLQCHKNRYVYEIFWSVELRYVAEYNVLFPPWFAFMQEKRVASRGSSLALGRKLRTWW